MSGGGKIIEKHLHRLEDGREVMRYRVMSEYRPGWFDETFVLAERADEEPRLAESIWWGGEQVIYFGANDEKRLTKVGYSWSADRAAAE